MYIQLYICTIFTLYSNNKATDKYIYENIYTKRLKIFGIFKSVSVCLLNTRKSKRCYDSLSRFYFELNLITNMLKYPYLKSNKISFYKHRKKKFLVKSAVKVII